MKIKFCKEKLMFLKCLINLINLNIILNLFFHKNFHLLIFIRTRWYFDLSVL